MQGMRPELPEGSVSVAFQFGSQRGQGRDFASAEPVSSAMEQVNASSHGYHAYASPESSFPRLVPMFLAEQHPLMAMSGRGSVYDSQAQQAGHQQLQQANHQQSQHASYFQAQHYQQSQQLPYQSTRQPHSGALGSQDMSVSGYFRDSGLAAGSNGDGVMYPPFATDSFNANTFNGSQNDQQPSSSIPAYHSADTVPDSQKEVVPPTQSYSDWTPETTGDASGDGDGEGEDSIAMITAGRRRGGFGHQQRSQTSLHTTPASTNVPERTTYSSPREAPQLGLSPLPSSACASQGQVTQTFSSPTRRADEIDDDEDAEGEEDTECAARKDERPSPSKRARHVEQSMSGNPAHSSSNSQRMPAPFSLFQPRSAMHTYAGDCTSGRPGGDLSSLAPPSTPSSQQPTSAQLPSHRDQPVYDVFSSSPLPAASGLPAPSLPPASTVPILTSGMSMHRGEAAFVPSSGQRLANSFEIQLESSPWPPSQRNTLAQTPSRSSLSRHDSQVNIMPQSQPTASLPQDEAIVDYSSDLEVQEADTGENFDTQAILDEDISLPEPEREGSVEKVLEDKHEEETGNGFDPALMAILSSVSERNKDDPAAQVLAQISGAESFGSKSWVQRSPSDILASLQTAVQINEASSRRKRAVAETPERTQAESPEAPESRQASVPIDALDACSSAKGGNQAAYGKLGVVRPAPKAREKPLRGVSVETKEEDKSVSSTKRGTWNRGQPKHYQEITEDDVQDEPESAAGSDVAEAAPAKKKKGRAPKKLALTQEKSRKVSGKVKGKKQASRDNEESSFTQSSDEDEDNVSDENYEEIKSAGKKSKGKPKKGTAGKASPPESLPRGSQTNAPSSQEASQTIRPRKILKVPNLSRLKEFDDQVGRVIDAFGGQGMIKERIADSKKETAEFKKETKARNKKIPTDAQRLKVCPICDEKWPIRPSMELRNDGQLMLDRIHSEGLSSIERLAAVPFCKKHRAESTIIPEGIKKGWPDTLDLGELEARILDESVWRHIEEIVVEPERGFFFAKVKEFYTQNGRKASSGLMGFQQMEREQAGYFGELGWERIFKTLMGHFVNQGDRNRNVFLSQAKLEQISPMAPNQFITGVLLPEICCRLMVQDLEEAGKPATMEDADKLRNDSNAYGITMFSASAQEVSEESSEEEEGEDDDDDFEAKPRRGKARKAQAEANAKVKVMSKFETEPIEGKAGKSSRSGKTVQTTMAPIKTSGFLSDSD